MVLAAPVALLAASRRARAFVGANQQAFFNLGMGVFALVVTMKNVAYRYKLKEQERCTEEAQEELEELKQLLTARSDDWFPVATERLGLESKEDAFVDELLRAFSLTSARMRGDAADIEQAGGHVDDDEPAPERMPSEPERGDPLPQERAAAPRSGIV